MILRKTGSCESEFELNGETAEAEVDADAAAVGDLGAAAGGDLGAAAGEAGSGRLVVVEVCTGAGNECRGVKAGALLSALVLAPEEEETAQLFAFDAEEGLCFLLDFFEAEVVELELGATSKAHHD